MVIWLVIHSVMLTLCMGVALASLQRARKRATSVDLARFERLVADLSEEQRALLQSHKRLRSRVGMRELREKREGEPEDDGRAPEETPEQWKARMRREIATGKRSHE